MTIGVVLLKVHPATAERLSALVPQVEERVLLGIAGKLVVLSLDREP